MEGGREGEAGAWRQVIKESVVKRLSSVTLPTASSSPPHLHFPLPCAPSPFPSPSSHPQTVKIHTLVPKLANFSFSFHLLSHSSFLYHSHPSSCSHFSLFSPFLSSFFLLSPPCTIHYLPPTFNYYFPAVFLEFRVVTGNAVFVELLLNIGAWPGI